MNSYSKATSRNKVIIILLCLLLGQRLQIASNMPIDYQLSQAAHQRTPKMQLVKDCVTRGGNPLARVAHRKRTAFERTVFQGNKEICIIMLDTIISNRDQCEARECLKSLKWAFLTMRDDHRERLTDILLAKINQHEEETKRKATLLMDAAAQAFSEEPDSSNAARIETSLILKELEALYGQAPAKEKEFKPKIELPSNEEFMQLLCEGTRRKRRKI